MGGEAIAVQADCGNPDDIAAMMKATVDAFGTVDCIVNNAGITKDGLVMRMKPEQWQSVIDVNLSGVFYASQAFFKVASKKRKGRIINISSVVGQFGNPGQANYAAAKGGVIGLTMSNAKEVSQPAAMRRSRARKCKARRKCIVNHSSYSRFLACACLP